LTTVKNGCNVPIHVALRPHHLMLPVERQKEILEEIRGRHAVKAEDLSIRFGVSVETVRRDLRQLADKGLLERVYGGAALSLVSPYEASFDQRRTNFATQKAAIASLAATFLEGGETILIDVGTTCHEFAKAVPASWSGRVITNSVLAAVELAERPDVEVVLAGGRLRAGDLACSGHYAAKTFDDFYVGLAFVGSGAVHPTAGLTDYHPDEADLRRGWLSRVGRAYLLADSSKLGEVAPCRVSPMERFDALITDDGINTQLFEDFNNEDVNVLVANTGHEGLRASVS
jgi:DeoR family transcriptional regulator, fructose operon transcriptional repressor